MITILVVGADDSAVSAFGEAHPSVEIVTARGPEEALETLARNRRIDAVLILASPEAHETAALIAEEDPGAPPVFAAVDGVSGTRSVEPGPPQAMLDRIVRALSA
jgi:hypothetical protein